MQTPAVQWTDPERHQFFSDWVRALAAPHRLNLESLQVASADASFRRYLRVDSQLDESDGSMIIMDAPPTKEDCEPFVRIAGLMDAAGLVVPKILDWNRTQGFILMRDLGNQTMMAAIDPASASLNLPLYLEAVDCLIHWQLASRAGVLPDYNEALLRRELELFPEWYVARHRSYVLSPDQRRTLDEAFGRVIAHNLQWPSVYVHRDYMPRNLMVGLAHQAPPLSKLPPSNEAGFSRSGSLKNSERQSTSAGMGILDFQDAVYGPITYDIASLLRDAFLSWEEEFVLEVTIRYWERARKAGLPVGDDFGLFYQGVEWMGLQRHLKVAGIFARLTLRDGKPKYLADAPRFINYIRATCGRYMELKPLLRLVEKLEGIEFQSPYAHGRF